MNWNMTKTMVAAGGAILVVALAAVVKPHFFPGIKDAYFDPDVDKLRLLPAGLVVARPTHFPQKPAKMRHLRDDGGRVTRTLGRDVPLRDAIAEACDCNPSRVELPPDAPTGGFDFLVTTGDARDRLRTAIETKLGYVAHRESRNVEIWAMKVANPDLPGLKISPEGEPAAATAKDGKLYLTHQPLRAILAGLSEGLNQPVVDETGLTNDYDFAVPWNSAIENKMQSGTFSLDGVKKVLQDWGLCLEPDTQAMDVFVVQKAH